jgi:hypothetical protein
MSEIKFEKVISLYNGIPNRCYCGCSGNHYYNSQHQELAGKNRGYEVLDDEINDKKIIRAIKKYFTGNYPIERDSSTIVSVTLKSTVLTLYLMEEEN